MAKKGNKTESKLGGDTAPTEAPAGETTAEAPKAAVPKSRGPRGVEESAVITVLSSGNPKRAGSKAFAVFSHYVNGMSVKDFADALEKDGLGKEATPNLVYDAKHGFISIAGYDPGQIIVAKPKVVKAPKEKKAADPAAAAADTTAQAEATAETVE